MWLVSIVGLKQFMKPKVIFNLAIRLLGLVFLYHGLMAVSGLVPLIFSGVILGSLINVFMCAWQLVVAWWLIGGAPLLSQRAYPDGDDGD